MASSKTTASNQYTTRHTYNLLLYPDLEVSTLWIFTPRLPWTVLGFVTHCQRFVNGLEINVKTNTIVLKLIKFVTIVLAKYLLFLSII